MNGPADDARATVAPPLVDLPFSSAMDGFCDRIAVMSSSSLVRSGCCRTTTSPPRFPRCCCCPAPVRPLIGGPWGPMRPATTRAASTRRRGQPLLLLRSSTAKGVPPLRPPEARAGQWPPATYAALWPIFSLARSLRLARRWSSPAALAPSPALSWPLLACQGRQWPSSCCGRARTAPSWSSSSSSWPPPVAPLGPFAADGAGGALAPQAWSSQKHLPLRASRPTVRRRRRSSTTVLRARWETFSPGLSPSPNSTCAERAVRTHWRQAVARSQVTACPSAARRVGYPLSSPSRGRHLQHHRRRHCRRHAPAVAGVVSRRRRPSVSSQFSSLQSASLSWREACPRRPEAQPWPSWEAWD